MRNLFKHMAVIASLLVFSTMSFAAIDLQSDKSYDNLSYLSAALSDANLKDLFKADTAELDEAVTYTWKVDKGLNAPDLVFIERGDTSDMFVQKTALSAIPVIDVTDNTNLWPDGDGIGGGSGSRLMDPKLLISPI